MNTTKLKKIIETVIINPSSYVALVIGAFWGAIGGGLGGCIAGVIVNLLSKNPLTPYLQEFINWPPAILGYTISANNMNFFASVMITTTFGAVIGSITTSISTILCIYLSKQPSLNLSDKTIKPIIKFSCLIAGILGCSLFLGSLIGVAINQLYGAVIGGFFGFAMTLLILIISVRNQLIR